MKTKSIKMLKQIIPSLIFALILQSCPNDQMRDLVELKVSDPVADSFIINSGAPTAETAVTLNSDVTKEEDALEMRFKNAGYSWSEWEAYSPEKTWTLSAGDGIKTVYAEYRDEGHHVISKTSTIVLNTGAPAGNFYIWGTAISGNQHEFVNSQTATLCMNITNVKDMRFSNDGGTTWSSWIPFSETYEWSLAAGDGVKTVDAEFRTNSGTVTSSTNSTPSGNPPVLDTTAPAVSGFTINSGDASVNNTGATLTYNFSETNSVWAEYRNDGGSWSASEAVSGSSESKSWTLRAEEGSRTVYARLTDIAGNVSSAYSDDIYLDTAAPAAPSVTSSETYTQSTKPEWTWAAVSGAVNYRYSYDDSFWTDLGDVTSFTPGSDLEANFSYTLYVRAVDSEGRESESGSYTVYIDVLAPVISDMSLNQPIYSIGDDIIFSFTATDSVSGIDIGSITATIASYSALVSGSGSEYTAVYTLSGAIPDGSYPVNIIITDRAGNSINTSFSPVVIDTTAPEVTAFIINNGNTYSCSPYGRVTSSTPESGLTMQLTGTSSTAEIPYADTYDIQNSGTVTGSFLDAAGNATVLSDAITMKTADAEDRRYENQSMPSHIAAAAYDLGSASDWDIHGGDYAEGELTTHLSGEATLWDEDWYRLTLDTGYTPVITITSASSLSSTMIHAYYDEACTLPVTIINYSVAGDGLSASLVLDWDYSVNGEKTIWFKISTNDGNYSGFSYDMTWFISIL